MATKTVNGITTEIASPIPAPSGTEYKLINGNSEMTWGENEEEKYLTAKAVVDQKATEKANGTQKLLDLGLSQAEIDALVGN